MPAAAVAGVARRLVRVSALLTLPIAISVVLVSVFTRAGTTVLFQIGPFDATGEGVDFAGQTLVRLFAISTSIGLFGLTTDPRALVLDLERRGCHGDSRSWRRPRSSRCPRWSSAPRSSRPPNGPAGSTRRAASGPGCAACCRSSAPVILSSLTEVEERTLALEVRAFGRPGRRHLLWWAPDTTRERVLRWALVLVFLTAVVLRVTGHFPAIP